MEPSRIKLGQAGKPKGIIGKLFGLIMSKFNKADFIETIKHLDIEENQRILEIGFGSGDALKAIIKKQESVVLFGVDHSLTMLKMAVKKNKTTIQSGLLKLQIADVEQLPFCNNYFDTIFSINCIYFWENPRQSLLEIKRVLKKNGRLVILVRNSKHGLNKHYNAKTLTKLYKEVAFKKVKIISSQKRIMCFGLK